MDEFLPSIKIEVVNISQHNSQSDVAVKLTLQRVEGSAPEIYIVDLNEIIQKSKNTEVQEDFNYDSLFHNLTNREQEVLILVAAGATSIEIAEKLYISVNTVKNHRRNVKKKLNLYEMIEYSKFLRWVLFNITSV